MCGRYVTPMDNQTRLFMLERLDPKTQCMQQGAVLKQVQDFVRFCNCNQHCEHCDFHFNVIRQTVQKNGTGLLNTLNVTSHLRNGPPGASGWFSNLVPNQIDLVI